MNMSELIKDYLLNEVGDASKTPFKSKRDLSKGFNTMTRYEASKEQDAYTYTFTTKRGYTYSVTIEKVMGRGSWGRAITDDEWKEELSNLYKYDRGLYMFLRKNDITREDLRKIWSIGFGVQSQPKDEPRSWDGYLQEPNKGEFYRVMATVVKIVKDHLKKYGGKVISYRPADERRGRIFPRFITQQLPNARMYTNGYEESYFVI